MCSLRFPFPKQRNGQTVYVHSISGVVRSNRPERGVLSAVEERIAANERALADRQRERLCALRAAEQKEEMEARAVLQAEAGVNRRVAQVCSVPTLCSPLVYSRFQNNDSILRSKLIAR
jgi:hypothetical protein